MTVRYIKSTVYSEIIDDYIYCVVNRDMIDEQNYGKELRMLRTIHDANEFLEGYVASLN